MSSDSDGLRQPLKKVRRVRRKVAMESDDEEVPIPSAPSASAQQGRASAHASKMRKIAIESDDEAPTQIKQRGSASSYLSKMLTRPTEGVWHVSLDGITTWGQAHLLSSGYFLLQKGSRNAQPFQIDGDGASETPFCIGTAKLIESGPGFHVWLWPNGAKSTWTRTSIEVNHKAQSPVSAAEHLCKSRSLPTPGAVASTASPSQRSPAESDAEEPLQRCVTCNAGHELKQCVGDASCDRCGRQGIIAPEFTFRCEECDFDLCVVCCARPKEVADEAEADRDTFPIGCTVEAHSLSTAALNGLRGRVLGFQGERVRVKFQSQGEKALKPINLKRLCDMSSADSDEDSETAEPIRSRHSLGLTKAAARRRPQRLAAKRAMATISGLTEGDSDAEPSRISHGDKLAASDGESSDDYYRGPQQAPPAAASNAPSSELPDVLRDAQAESWQLDLEARRTSPLDPRSSFSSTPCKQKMIQSLPDSSRLNGGRPIFDSSGLVNLHLLVGAYAQLASSVEACHNDEGARHILWLAEAARSLQLLSLDQLRQGRLAQKRQREAEEAPAPDVTYLTPEDSELRFPARPLAGKRKAGTGDGDGDGDGFFSDEEDDMEKFMRRKRTVMQLRSKNNAAKAHIISHSSTEANITEIKDRLTAPSLSFDWNLGGQGQKSNNDDDDDDAITLEVSVPEDDPNRESRRGLFKDSIQRSISLRWAKALKGEDAPKAEASEEAEGGEQGVAVRATRRKRVLLECGGDMQEAENTTTVPKSSPEDEGDTPTCTTISESVSQSEVDSLPASKSWSCSGCTPSDPSSQSLPTSDGMARGSAETPLSVMASEELPVEGPTLLPDSPMEPLLTEEEPHGNAAGPEVPMTTEPCPSSSAELGHSELITAPLAVAADEKRMETKKQERKMKQAILLDMFKRSLPTTFKKEEEEKVVESASPMQNEDSQKENVTEVDISANEAEAPQCSRLRPLTEAALPETPAHKFTVEVKIEEADGSYRASCTCKFAADQSGSCPVPATVGPWRSAPEKAKEDGEVMSAAAHAEALAAGSPAGSCSDVPQAWTDALEGAFPALRRLRRLRAGVQAEGAEEDESDEEGAEEDDTEDDTLEENAEEVVLSNEFQRHHRDMLRRKRRQARRLDRKLRFELGDISEIRDEVERMVTLGTATMCPEEQQRWQQVIDATFATPLPVNSSTSVHTGAKASSNNLTVGDTRSQLPLPTAPQLLFGGRGEDDGGDLYCVAGTAAAVVRKGSSFLSCGASPVIDSTPDNQDLDESLRASAAGRQGQTFLTRRPAREVSRAKP